MCPVWLERSQPALGLIQPRVSYHHHVLPLLLTKGPIPPYALLLQVTRPSAAAHGSQGNLAHQPTCSPAQLEPGIKDTKA